MQFRAQIYTVVCHDVSRLSSLHGGVGSSVICAVGNSNLRSLFTPATHLLDR